MNREDFLEEDYLGLEEKMALKEKRTLAKLERNSHKIQVGESQKRGRRTLNSLIQIAGSARGKSKLKIGRGGKTPPETEEDPLVECQGM